MAMLLFVKSLLWRIIGDAGFVVSSIVPSAQALLSFHLLTGKREHARAELSVTIELYRAMEMQFWLPQAEATLAQVE
jgi:hypothetical protein